MIRIIILSIAIIVYTIYKIYKLIDTYRFDKIQEQYFVEKSEMQKAEYKKEDMDNDYDYDIISINRYARDHNLAYKIIPNYRRQDYVMEYNELKFYEELKKITDKKGWVIFPQVPLYSIVSVNNRKKFQKLFPKLKGRSVDFVVCNAKKSCKIVMCIELEGSIHNKPFKELNDKFKDDLFEEVGIKFVRAKKKNSYNYNDLYEELGIVDDEKVEKAKKDEELSYFSTSSKDNAK